MYILDKLVSLVEDFFGIENSNNNKSEEQDINYEDISIFTAGRNERGVNGMIDEPVYQGNYGDCWLMTGVLSMSYAKNGAQKLRNSMDIYRDGSVDVTFKGANRKYSISKSELDANNKVANASNSNYSTGDDDMLAIELAVEKIVKDRTVQTNYSIQKGGNPYYIYKLYDADTVQAPRSKESLKQALDKGMMYPNKCAMAFGIANKDTVLGVLKKGHSYAVKSVDENKVTVIDPWDSTREIRINKKVFLDNYQNITMMYAEFR